MLQPRLFVSTAPFCQFDPRPREWLDEAGIEVVENSVGHRLTESDLINIIGEFDYLIAGTEPLTARVFEHAKRLKLIARVGIGLDSVDLIAAREAGIVVSYTPDAPSPAVAELAIGLMIDLLRQVTAADRELRSGYWGRHMGRRLSQCSVGVIGTGRIGTRVIRHLQGGFPGVKILANDLEPDTELDGVVWLNKPEIYQSADIITLHVPLTNKTRHMISDQELAMIRAESFLINTARGGIVDETALFRALDNGQIAGAAIDTFLDEPYSGPLTQHPKALLTCHMGSMTQDCRSRMEIEATQEVLRHQKGEPQMSEVPDAEYLLAQQR